MTNTTTPAQYPTSVTVPEGETDRIYGWIAADDHNAAIIAGTYPIRYARYSDSQSIESGSIEVEIIEPERQMVTSALMGRVMSTRMVPESREKHVIRWYGYQLQDAVTTPNGWVLNYACSTCGADDHTTAEHADPIDAIAEIEEAAL